MSLAGDELAGLRGSRRQRPRSWTSDPVKDAEINRISRNRFARMGSPSLLSEKVENEFPCHAKYPRRIFRGDFLDIL